jgi:plastocyanin
MAGKNEERAVGAIGTTAKLAGLIVLVAAFAGVAAVAYAGAGSQAAAPHSHAAHSHAAHPHAAVRPAAVGIDPRSGGFEVGLGEWALGLEAKAIRPGPVTFVIKNRGKFRHGLELELRRVDDARGGDGDDEKAESIRLEPGRATKLTLNLKPGVYELECFVSHHDDLGMRAVLEVREDAPLIVPRKQGGSTVEITGFAFKPATLRVPAGTTVTWRNADTAPHTATGNRFSSPQLRKGGTYRRKFLQPGTYAYLCALHPGMRAKLIVTKAK